MPNELMPLDEFEKLPYDRNSTVMTMDDFNNLGEVNMTPKTPRQNSLVREMQIGADQTLGGTPSNIGKMLIWAGDHVRNEADKSIFGVKPLAGAKPLGERISNLGMRIYSRNQDALKKREAEAGPTDTAGKVARDIGGGVVSLAGALGLGLAAGPAAPGVAFGASAGLEGYIESRKKGKGYDESVRIAGMLGFAEGALEFVGVDRMINASGGILKRAIKGYITEGLQESSQSLASNTIKVASGLREFKTKEDLLNIMGEAGYEGAIGGILGGPAAVAIAVSQRQAIEDGYKAMGIKPKRAREMADSIMKRGMDDVMSAAEALELGPSSEMKEGLLKSESGQMVLPDLPFLAEEKREEIYQKVVNRFQSIENTVEKAKKLGAKILPGEDAGISADRYLSIANQAESVLNNGTFQVTAEGNVEVSGEGLRPILKDFDANSIEKNASVREKELDEYLIARRTVEDLQRPSEEGGENIASQEQVESATKRITALQAKYGDSFPLFELTAKRIYDFQKRILLSLVSSNNMSKEQYDAILALNPNYVPFHRIMPDENEEFAGMPMNKKRFSGAKSPVKKIKGSDLEIHDPIENIIKNTHVILDRAARNKVFTDIYALKDFKELGIEEVDKPGKNTVTGYIDGNPVHLKVSENLKDAMNGMTETSSNIFSKILSLPAKTLRIGATITPEFILRNPIRDQWVALIQTEVGFRPFIDPIEAIADITGNSQVYQDWIRSGGSFAGFVELARPNLGKMLDKMRDKKNIPLNIISTPANISRLMEQATRVGVFKAALRKGLTMVEAARESRESTLNFARRGSQTKEWNNSTAFFNAMIQGYDKTVRTFQSNPKAALIKAISSVTIPSLLFYLINRDEPEYFELPRWQKDLFWNFKWGGTWVRIPKPFSYGQMFGSLPERFFEFLDTKDPEALSKLEESIINAVSPLGQDPLSTILPTALKTIVETVTNHSFFREGPIVPMSEQRLIPSEQYTKYNTKTAKAIGKYFGVSPAKLENFIQGWSGGSGRYALEAGDLFQDYVINFGKEKDPKRPTELSDIPLIKGFVSRSPVGNQSESVRKFYERKKDIDALYNTYNKFKKEDKQKARQLKEKNPQLVKSTKLSKYTKKFKAIDEKVQKIIDNKKMPDSDKRQAIKELEQSKTVAAQEALNFMDQ